MNKKVKNWKQFLNENRQHKEILHQDKHGNNVVFESGDYRIVVDSPTNATFVTLWFKEDEWVKVGTLCADVSERRFDWDSDFEKYLKISYIEIKPEHRGKKFSSKMYDALINFSNPNVKGLYSHLPDRANKKQIPRIYSKYKTVTVDDYQVILF